MLYYVLLVSGASNHCHQVNRVPHESPSLPPGHRHRLPGWCLPPSATQPHVVPRIPYCPLPPHAHSAMFTHMFTLTCSLRHAHVLTVAPLYTRPHTHTHHTSPHTCAHTFSCTFTLSLIKNNSGLRNVPCPPGEPCELRAEFLQIWSHHIQWHNHLLSNNMPRPQSNPRSTEAESAG